MKIITIDNKQELVNYRAEIQSLFQECFGGRQIESLWDWAYIENPNGEPLVTLCYDDDRLVGHYAIMPMPICRVKNKINSYLSMTTMVSESHRKYGLFSKLASENYKVALSSGIDFIMGFPNAMSIPGFRKRLSWVLPPSDYVATISKNDLLEIGSDLLSNIENTFSSNLYDQKNRSWRMSRPGANYTWNEGLLYKEFRGAIDLMYYDSINVLNKLPEDKNINILLNNEITQFQDRKIFDYQFGGVTINKDFEPSIISRQMCLSDVF